MKTFNTQQNVGRAKYVVNHHNGVTVHKDGSPFFALNTFSCKKKYNAFIRDLQKDGYTEQ